MLSSMIKILHFLLLVFFVMDESFMMLIKLTMAIVRVISSRREADKALAFFFFVNLAFFEHERGVASLRLSFEGVGERLCGGEG